MSKLPEGWTWKDCPEFYKPAGSDLYAPYGCHAAEIRQTSSWPTTDSDFYSHTWDEEGCGGENSVHKTLEEAKAFVEAAILRQGFHMECDLNCSDHGCVEEAAEIASMAWDSLSGDARDTVQEIVEAMLGPKRFREWCEETGE